MIIELLGLELLTKVYTYIKYSFERIVEMNGHKILMSMNFTCLESIIQLMKKAIG